MAEEAKLRQSLRKIASELQVANRRVRELERKDSEPIAIVGMSCRLPGGASSPEALWRLLAEGCDGVSQFPEDRGWDLERIYDPDPEVPGTSYVRHGGFLADAGDFDPGFFSISPREAIAMDPQQRLLLEGAWEAFEDAGIGPTTFAGSSTGVFAGVMSPDYAAREAFGSPELEAYLGIGLSGSVASGRVAYALGVQGPAVTIDTACSSSLVAVHLAAQALRSKECDLAIAGGTTVLASPAVFISMSRQRGAAPDGRCKSFAAAADGAGFSEGCGLLLLERLSDAQRNDRRILAVIRGSAINQDGASNGLTAPNGPSQERVIRQALANAGLSPSEVDAVEAHGTGTTLGDPIEAQALLATYGQERNGGGPLLLGSLKSNIGHTQAAAGVGGVVKMVMALREEQLPRTLHVDEPTPHVDWDSGEIELLTEARPWLRREAPRRAGISSFGISGTNAHLILEEAPEVAASEMQSRQRPPTIPWALSAKTPEALKEAASRLVARVQETEPDPLDIAHTLLTGRATFEHRAVVVGSDSAELVSGLAALAQDRSSPNVERARATVRPKLAFLFTGQGSQRAQMGKELYSTFPTYADAFDVACEALECELEQSVKDAVFAEPGTGLSENLGRTDLTQASLFALETALFRLAANFGLAPDYLIGHSIGEVTAAHLAGVLSLEDAAKLVAARGKLMAQLPPGGAMASARATEQEVQGGLASYEGRLCIAGVNGPGSVVVSGDEEALLEWEQEQGLETRRLRVSHAFHSHRMEPMLTDFEEVAAQLAFNAPQIPIVSNVTGKLLTEKEARSPGYWARQIREPVRFAEGVGFLRDQGVTGYLELGPDAVLSAFTQGVLDGEETVAASLRRDRPDGGAFSTALGALHAHGAEIDWSTVLEGGRPVDLPTYPFQRQRFWLEATNGSGDLNAVGQSPTEHPFLGASIALAGDGSHLFTGRISLKAHPWLADHAVGETALLPGVAFCELALLAGAEVGARRLEELVLEAPLPLPNAGAVQLQVSLDPGEEEERFEVAVYSRPEATEEDDGGEERPWIRHASGLLAVIDESPSPSFEAAAWPPPDAEPIDTDTLYDLLAEAGVDYGPAFQGLGAAWRIGHDVYAEVTLAEDQRSEADSFGVHPALMDAALHPAFLAGKDQEAELRLPFSFAGVSLGEGRGAATLRVRVRVEGEKVALDAWDTDSTPAFSITSLSARPFDPSLLQALRKKNDALFRVNWTPADLPEASEATEDVEVFEVPAAKGDPAEAAQALSEMALERIQGFLAGDDHAERRLACLTEGAMAAAAGEAPDPAAAALWGLVRSAQSEHPGRFTLIDTDSSEASREVLPAALALTEEPQLALREGSALVPRLAPVGSEEAPVGSISLDPNGTVLITGGLSGVGAMTARHLAERHGARRLLLTSRRGPEAPEADELKAELEGLGCEVEIAACDVADRSQLADLLATIPADHPLTAVIHSAAVIDDGTIESLDPERLARVMRPKVEAAWHLHELTRGADLQAFVLYSSVAATLGSPGQGNYAAANSFLDGIAEQRHHEGLPATSMAWGLWEQESEITAELSEADRARLSRSGFAAIATEQGFELLDRMWSEGYSHQVATPIDAGVLRSLAQAELLPPLLSGLVPASRRRARAAGGSLARRLAATPEADREAVVLSVVREHVATVLGYASPEDVDPKTNFKDLGFDSLGAVELRNRLAQATGVRLEATLVFDHPTVEGVARYLLGQIEGSVGPAVAVRASSRLDEPIAIVGMSCRYPGGASSPEALWRLLAAGGDGVSEFPEDRGWDLDRIYDPDPDRPGTSYVRHGGFLENAAEFDPGFFSISPREALAMDPQQRLLLEGAWEAVEDAGIDPASLGGSSTGVFAGVMAPDYAGGGKSVALSPELEGYLPTGLPVSIASGRVAYALGLQGPTMTIDTACSSSLVALHLAAGALRSGECDLALAGGTTVISTPMAHIAMSRQRVLAPDGRCKSFAAAADGTTWSEGSGLLLLERLSDAERNGRRILAVIRGSATNQDGASNGLTAPNGPSQERVIRQALANAGLTPSEVDAVDAHGTGTVLGDPIEAQALLATYGQERNGSGPLYLGSLKSNIGHTQAAAGVGGVIKMLMALREETLPQTLHIDEPTPHVDWEAGDIELLTEPTPWPRGNRPRRAGVSSFGISGTNAHLILEEAPAEVPEGEKSSRQPPAVPWALSAKTPEALAEAAGRLAATVEQDGPDPLDVAHTLVTARPDFEHRAVVVGSDRDELLAGLDALAQGNSAPNVMQARASGRPKVAFVFPGQGSQWLGMAARMLDESELFATKIAACEEALAPVVDWSLQEILRSEDPAWLERVEVVQPALFAVMVSLAELWRSHGVEPAAVVGHSQGEIAAAVVAGALSLEDGARLAALRAEALIPLIGKGDMVSLAAAAEEAEALIAPYGDRLAIAALNGPRSTVISGEPEALKELLAICETDGIHAREIPVGYASHCAQVEAIEADLREGIEGVEAGEAAIRFYSTVTGEPLETTALDADYWFANLRQPVQFDATCRRLLEDGFTAFVEVSSHPVLSIALEESAEAKEATILHTLRREEGDFGRFLTSLGEAHVHGVGVDFSPLLQGGQLVDLPTYPFQRERFWLEASSGSGDATSLGQSPTEHPFLGAAIALASEGSHLFTGRISLKTHPWLADHAVGTAALLPGVAFCELALRAGAEVGADQVEELVLEAPLVLLEAEAVQLQVTLNSSENQDHFDVEIFSRPEIIEDGEEERPWTRHAHGVLRLEEPSAFGFDTTVWPPPSAEPLDTDDLYGLLAEAGFDYGPAFQGLEAAWRAGDDLFAEITLAEEQRGEAELFGVHPALMDAALHPVFLAGEVAEGELRLPFSFAGVRLGAGRGTSKLRVRVRMEQEKIALEASDPDGQPVVSIESLSIRPLDPKLLQAVPRKLDALFTVDWVPVELVKSDKNGKVELFECPGPQEQPAEATPALAAAALEKIQSFLANDTLAYQRLAFITEGAMAAAEGESPEPALAALWGLVRSAQSEHPGRFALIDTDGSDASKQALAAALALTEEPQLALREGAALAPRLSPAGESELQPPEEGPWRLEAGEGGTLESLELIASPEAERDLGPGEVRVAVRSAGLNFRDALIALGLYPGGASIGGEGAGVVVETGPDVEELEPGDRVFGMVAGAFGPLALTDRRLLARLPDGWSFAQGAAMPVAFCTAHYGLVDLAGLKSGERVLIHSGAGGVGMAAIQLARHLGAEVFATASPGKWEALRGFGLDDDHIASSRDLEFKDKFLRVTGGEGVDVVLDALAREFVDASLDLLPRGGRFVEMGKTDLRDPGEVAAAHPGVAYRAFDLTEAGPERLGETLTMLLDLIESGALRHPPIAAWDVRRARDAFRYLSQARHTGKLVLTVPQAPDPEGTVLITGGLSGVGAMTARHLAEQGAKRLLLTSRRGADAPGAAQLQEELAGLGCEATVAACDVGDRPQLEKLLAAIPDRHPLTAVIHSAAVLDDGTIESLDAGRLQGVFAPKAEAAWHLHELTRQMDLDAFVLYSSAAATLGSAGQGNYLAASAFLDALAERRRAEGLPGVSIAWGLWDHRSDATAHVSEEDRARLSRKLAEVGFSSLAPEEGMELFDRACALTDPLVVVTPLQGGTLRAMAQAELLPPLLMGLVRTSRRRPRDAEAALAHRLASVPEAEREALVLSVVTEHVATVLGHASPGAVDPKAKFKDLGFDSLGAVELRNRLAQATGVRLEATLVFDYPTVEAVSRYLLEQIEGEVGSAVVVRSGSHLDEPIAIVGMSCRFPGGATSPDALWRLLASGVDGVSEFPADRGWDLERIYDPDPEKPGTSYVRSGGFLDDVAEFDPAFFSISPREALAMDPQQRLLLEGAWEAIEDARIAPPSLSGSSTGVFVGVMAADYADGGKAFTNSPRHSGIEGYLATGFPTSVASGRLAYALGLQGPAVSIDTACSSSLVAMHLAAQALRGNECDLAVAGGSTVLASPGAFISMSSQRAAAPDGRCKSFAQAADGAGFSEGCGLLVLERLSDAQRNGRRILAVIRGSATNQDGASNGLTAPNGPSQERVIRQALANAGLAPGEIDAVEGHGTGTVLGDPIEAQALLATYGRERNGAGPLYLGSLKSNIGHSQAAAGVGGVIKMVMALREEALPRTLHVDEPTPHVDWKAGEIELLTEARPWTRGGRPRRAGVSSFGISGTNAHLILEESPDEAVAPAEEQARQRPPAIPWAISAKNPDALGEAAGRLAARVEEGELDPLDVAHTLLTGRAAFDHRAVVVGTETEELLSGLDALVQGKEAPNLVQAKATSRPKVAFVFPGQGSQWLGMTAQLVEESEDFAQRIAECEEALTPHVEWSLQKVLRSEDPAWLERVDMVQPALFAVMVSLAGLWRAYGVEPGAVVGHSQGEIAAAVVAGALSLEEGARLAALRAKALIPLVGRGDMVSLAVSSSEAVQLIERFDDRCAVAAMNGPRSSVIAGEPDALAELLALCEVSGVRARRVSVGYASHCAQIDEIEQELREGIAGIDAGQPEVPFYSTVAGEANGTSALDVDYWFRNLREPVCFEAATTRLLEDGFTAFLEISVHPVLSIPLEECTEAKEAMVLHTLRRNEDGFGRFLAAMAEAHVHGLDPDWTPLLQDARLVDLPTYPFQRERFWVEASKGASDPTGMGLGSTDHPFLGASIALASEDSYVFTGRISLETHPWLADHVVGGTVLLPGIAFCELALSAGAEVQADQIDKLTLEAPLELPATGAIQLQVTLEASEVEGRFKVAIHSRPEPRDDHEEGGIGWTCHASGALFDSDEDPSVGFDAAAWPPPGAEGLPVGDLYDILAEAGFDYGPAFQGLEHAWRLGDEVFADVALAEDQREAAERFSIHPALMDAALHPALLVREGGEGHDALQLPFELTGVRFGEGRGVGSLRLRVRLEEEKTVLEAADREGRPVFSIASIVSRPLNRELLKVSEKEPDPLLALEWVEIGVGDAANTPPDVHGDFASLREALESKVESGQHFVYRPDSPPESDRANAAHALTATMLEVLQSFLGRAHADSRLTIITRNASSVGPDDVPDPPMAAASGLVRSAQAEHPGRFTLIDTDGSEASDSALAAALAIDGEHQLSLRDGFAWAPRLMPVPAQEMTEPAPLDPEGTVLITGGTGGLGGVLARHLVMEHGVKHLLLVSRRGRDASGAASLSRDLLALGAETVEVLAADVSERTELAGVLSSIPDTHPLTAVIHAAGVVENGLIDGLTSEQIDHVLRPKVDAAQHLHDLTKTQDLAAFVMYSSMAAIFGGPGQGNYAAANAYLDALAHLRRAQGLPATSIDWGMWIEAGLATELDPLDANRMMAALSSSAFRTLTPSRGLELFDAALHGKRAVVVAADVDRRMLRAEANGGGLPPLLWQLISRSARRRQKRGPGWLVSHLASMPREKWKHEIGDLLNGRVAVALGHAEASAIDPQMTFPELGFDSLASLQLRNWINSATGLDLPVSAAFDYPTPAALASQIESAVGTMLETGAALDVGGGRRTPAEPTDLSVGTLFRRAQQLGRHEEGAELLAVASKLRPRFDAESAQAPPSPPVQLARGSNRPMLICIPTLMATGGPHQYVGFAKAFGGSRDVVAVPVPGFLEGERLPTDLAAAARAQAEAVLLCAEGQPFTLLGHSTGGLFAHAIAEHLQSVGSAPAGLILVDTYPSDERSVHILPPAISGMWELDETHFSLNSTRLTAMVAYGQLIEGFSPSKLDCPSLLVRASSPMAGMPAEGWQTEWAFAGAAVDVPGDHFTIMEDHAASAAEAVEEWLVAGRT